MPRIAPLSNSISRPVSSGLTPAPTSIKGATLPLTITSPFVGLLMLARCFRSVLLPAPL